MLNNEDLLAISCLLDTKLEPINQKVDALQKGFVALDQKVDGMDKRLHHVELLLENDVTPRLQNIESCYVDTYERYNKGAVQIDAIQADVDILKAVATDHGEQIKLLSQAN